MFILIKSTPYPVDDALVSKKLLYMGKVAKVYSRYNCPPCGFFVVEADVRENEKSVPSSKSWSCDRLQILSETSSPHLSSKVSFKGGQRCQEHGQWWR